MPNKNKDDRYKAIRQAGLLTTIPFLLAASPIIGFFIGQFLDDKLNTGPILSIIFVILGFAAGAVQVAKVVKLANREPKKKNGDPRS